MESGLLHTHNFLRWLVLLFGVLALVQAAGGLSGNKPFRPSVKRMGMLFVTVLDIQLLLGVALFFMKGWGNVMSSGGGFMSNSAQRFFALEHWLLMLIALVVAHIGQSAAKKNIPDASKYKRIFWCFLIALVLIIAAIPWPFREMVARPLFPGMSV